MSAPLLEQYATRRLGFTRYGVADYNFNYTLPAGQWVHVTLVGSPSSMSLYVNGTFSQTIGAGIPLPRQYIGRNPAGASTMCTA